MSNVPGFDSRMWLDPTPGRDQYRFPNHQQYGEILHEFFDKIIDLSLIFEDRPIRTYQIKNGDLVVFLNDERPQHTGIVRGGDFSDLAKVTVRSKFGKYPVVDAPLEFVSNHNRAPEIMVYRRRGD